MHSIEDNVEETINVYNLLKQTFNDGVTLPLAFRRKQLLQFARMIQENIVPLQDAIFADLRKPPVECMIGEIGPVVGDALRAAESLERWTAPEKPPVENWKSTFNITMNKVPKGVVVVITPWNYPVIISLLPFIGAIAAGCTCLLKPSEHSPVTSMLMASLIHKYLDNSAYRVINGGHNIATNILELKWDHIFFTGSTEVGRLVAAAAAKHLTTCTLELGGKSPVYVDKNCDIKLAAKRILWGKQVTTGQICVAPDYVLVEKSRQSELIEAFKDTYKTFFPIGALHSSSSLARIVSPYHHNRLRNLLAQTKGRIVLGGNFDDNQRIEPTVIADIDAASDDELMKREIFGPILPVLTVNDSDEAIKFIKERPTPLAIYVFTNDSTVKDKFLQRTQSGSVVYNETVSQIGVPELPFGGKGESGYGSYFGKFSFDMFTHIRSSMDLPAEAESSLLARYPPYSQEAYEYFSAAANAPIPEV